MYFRSYRDVKEPTFLGEALSLRLLLSLALYISGEGEYLVEISLLKFSCIF